MILPLPGGLPNSQRKDLKGQLKILFNLHNQKEVYIFHQLVKTFIISVTLKRASRGNKVFFSALSVAFTQH